MRARSAAAATLMLIGTSGCHAGPDVVRLKDGHAIDGRWISPEAYARFLDGTLLEASGDDPNAALAYAAALVEDPNASGIWARLGAVRCTTNPPSADAAFTRAERLDPELEDAWLARAECQLRRGDAKGATRSALRAAALSPNDVEATLVAARAFEATGDPTRSARWLSALALRRPGMVIAEQAVEAQAARAGDRGRAEKTKTELDDVFASLDAQPLPAADRNDDTPAESGARDTAVARALVSDDRIAAAAAQVRAHLESADLALYAVGMGRIGFASEIAARVLLAEPGNVDAKVAALAAADLSHEPGGLEKQTTPLPRARTQLGALAARIMADLLLRTSGERAALAWVAASGATTGIVAPVPSSPSLK